MTTVARALEGVSRLGFDTVPIIYYIEANPMYDGRVSEVFAYLGSGRMTGVRSVVSLLEVLVLPMRQGNVALQREF